VTLSTELFRAMKAEARRLGVSLEWLVASLVADTMEEAGRDNVPLAASA
jgi:hypothetical protein